MKRPVQLLVCKCESCAHWEIGKDEKGLKGLVVRKTGEIEARDVCRVPIGKPEGQPEVFVRVGRYGPFLEQGDRRASIPEQTPPDELAATKTTGSTPIC